VKKRGRGEGIIEKRGWKNEKKPGKTAANFGRSASNTARGVAQTGYLFLKGPEKTAAFHRGNMKLEGLIHND